MESAFECPVGPDGLKTYRVGHELVDEFLASQWPGSGPSTVRAYAHDLKVLFGFVDKVFSDGYGGAPRAS